jgi:predicted O-methyltransferase YrrM
MTTVHTAHSVVDWTGYLFHEEVDALKDLARSLPQNAHIINIGAGNGTSGLAFMEARDDLRVTTIDITRESSPYGCLEGEEAVFRSAGFWGQPRHEQIHGDSKDVGASWDREQVDLVFVDGGHQEHEAWGDLAIWRALIKPGGIMAVHDYEKTEKVWPGVDRAVRRYIAEFGDEVILQVKTLIAFRVLKHLIPVIDDHLVISVPIAPKTKRGRR